MFILEIAGAIFIIVVVAVFIEVTPYLSSGQTSQIGVFNQRVYAEKTLTISQGQKASTQFNYTTYDPAILVIDLSFKNWQNPGNLSVYCNGLKIASFESTPSNPSLELTTITFSGYDLVRPPAPKIAMSNIFTYGNEISFVSGQANGFAGTFSYEVSIRGSR